MMGREIFCWGSVMRGILCPHSRPILWQVIYWWSLSIHMFEILYFIFFVSAVFWVLLETHWWDIVFFVMKQCASVFSVHMWMLIILGYFFCCCLGVFLIPSGHFFCILFMTFFWLSWSLLLSFRALALGVAGFAVADKRLQFSESGFRCWQRRCWWLCWQ